MKNNRHDVRRTNLQSSSTGATGYIGGEGLYALYKAHPDWKFSVLVRNEEKGKPVQDAYPNINLVYGTLDDAQVIEDAAADADIVLHTADSSDHEVSARAIAKGILKGHDSSHPGYWIHISGTGILCWYDMDNERYGEPPLAEQAYNDLEGVGRLLSLPDTAFHRDIDKIVLEAAAIKPDVMKIAIVCPPTIFGVGRGPANTRSRQVPGLVEATLNKGFGPKIGTGTTEWDNVHVQDLSNLFVLLAENAALGSKSQPSEEEIWGPKAYFLAENGSHVWGEVADWAAQEAAKKGYIEKAETKNLDVKEAEDMLGFQALSWGLNSKGKARRAKKFLGWEPTGESLKDHMKELIDSEAKLMGKA